MSGVPRDWSYDSVFDGKDTGCGEILIDLRMHFRDLGGGSFVLVTAHDEGAPVQLPAWCRLTGHRLVDARHPHYLIQVKERSPSNG